MKRFFTLCLLLIPVIALAQVSGGALKNIARAWLLDPPSQNTFVPSQFGMGWSDSKFTLRTPPGNLQFSTTGDPAVPVMTWPGRITASHIDVTSMSLFATAPASATSPGTMGQMAYDSNFFYICVALNSWKRTALSSW
jgi:hypothetical protein